MATFQTAYERLMRTINRPLTETNVLAGAKDAVNDAVMSLQRNQAFTYTEVLNTIVYPASALFINLGSVCGGPVRDFISCQQISSGGTYEGKPLKIMTYGSLQTKRSTYERKNSTYDPAYEGVVETMSWLAIEDAFRQDMILFISADSIGLYPRPETDITILLNMHRWLPVLAGDNDTNFFLDFAMDVVQMLALKRMSFYMKDLSVFPFSEKEVDDSIATLIAWDGQLTGNSNSSLA